MKIKFLNILLLLIGIHAFSQSGNGLNLDFEFTNSKTPIGWYKKGDDYSLEIDNVIKHSNKQSIKVSNIGPKPSSPLILGKQIRAGYNANEIVLEGYMKLQNVQNGFAGLFLRIDGESGILQFNNMFEENIHGTSDWTKYSIRLSYPKGAKVITVGCLLSGEGTLWVDDLTIKIDNININDAKLQSSYKADVDIEFDLKSGIGTIPSTPEMSQKLTKIGYLWGFLKYYHPNIAAGKFNWDYELFRILPKFIIAKKITEQNDIINNWLDSLGTFEVAGEQVLDTSDELIQLKPDFSWFDTCNFDSEIKKKLKNLVNAKRLYSNYYISLDSNVGNAVFINERDYPGMVYSDTGYRLLALFRYYSMIQYYYPYKIKMKDWNLTLTEFIPKFIKSSDESSYKYVVLELISAIDDSHAAIGLAPVYDRIYGSKSLPIELKFVEGKAVVTKVFNDYSDGKSIMVGDIVTAINNDKIENLIAARSTYSPASNKKSKLRDVLKTILRTTTVDAKVDLIRLDTPLKFVIPTTSINNLNNKENQFENPLSIIKDKIAYINIGVLKSEDLPAIFQQIKDFKGLIIDLRNYPAEFIVFNLANYLLRHPKDFAKFSYGSILLPGLFKLSDPVKIGEDNEGYFKGKVILLVDENTQSMGEYTAMALQLAPKCMVLGSTTAGADGNISKITLPSAINTAISGVGIFYPDGTETQRKGIIPDTFINSSIMGIRNNIDEQLQAAINLINN